MLRAIEVFAQACSLYALVSVLAGPTATMSAIYYWGDLVAWYGPASDHSPSDLGPQWTLFTAIVGLAYLLSLFLLGRLADAAWAISTAALDLLPAIIGHRAAVSAWLRQARPDDLDARLARAQGLSSRSLNIRSSIADLFDVPPRCVLVGGHTTGLTREQSQAAGVLATGRCAGRQITVVADEQAPLRLAAAKLEQSLREGLSSSDASMGLDADIARLTQLRTLLDMSEGAARSRDAAPSLTT